MFRFLKDYRCFAELFTLIILLIAFQQLLFPNELGFLSVHPHPFWGIAFFLIYRHDFQQVIVSLAILSGLYFLALYLQPHPFYYSSLTLIHDLKEPLLLLLVGGLMSELINRHKEKIRHLIQQVSAKDKLVKESETALKTQKALTHHFEQKIIWDETNVLAISRRLLEAATLDEKKFYEAVLDILIDESSVLNAHILKVEDTTLTLFAQSQASMALTEDPIAMQCFRSKQLVAIPFIDSEQMLSDIKELSLIAAPIIHNDTVTHIICISDIPFFNFTPQFVDQFNVIVTNISLLRQAK